MLLEVHHTVDRMSLGRLHSTAQFERLLRSPARERSAHFSVHYVPAGNEAGSTEGAAQALATELSTERVKNWLQPVDDLSARCSLGCVVPKRHARRSVTRNVIKRQVRAAAMRVEPLLDAGLWLVRLRSPFAATQFRSADSAALRQAVRDELDPLLTRCAAPPHPAVMARRGAAGARRKPESADLVPRP